MGQIAKVLRLLKTCEPTWVFRKSCETAAHRRIALKADSLMAGIDSEQISADDLLGGYCRMLYEKYGRYEAVGRRAQLDRRKRHLKPAGQASQALDQVNKP